VVLIGCSSSHAARKVTRTTVINGSIGDPTTPEWFRTLTWIDRANSRIPASSAGGTGDSRFALATAQRQAPLLAHITVWSAAPFVIDELDRNGARSLLLSRNGPYDGTTIVNSEGTTVALAVRTGARWRIRLADLRAAPSFSKLVRGSSDGVLLYRGRGQTLSTRYRGNSDFTAMYYGRAGTEDLTGDEYGNYSADAPVGQGDAIIVVQSAGTWTITAS
jgi:hypothetical protein